MTRPHQSGPLDLGAGMQCSSSGGDGHSFTPLTAWYMQEKWTYWLMLAQAMGSFSFSREAWRTCRAVSSRS